MRAHFFPVLLGVLFMAAGANHFVAPEFYRGIMPPYLPWPEALVAISGAAEVLGGLGLCLPRTRVAAGWGLMALLVAVFPANLYMALHPDSPAAQGLPGSLLWARLPLQAVLIAVVWRAGVRRR